MSTSEIDKQDSAVKEKPYPHLQASKTTEVQADEVKERLTELLRAVEENGDTVEITKDGAVVALLVPTLNREPTPEERKIRKEILERFKQERKTEKPTSMTFEELLQARRQ